MPEHCRTCQRALDSRWAWDDGRPVRVVACPRCDRVGRIHAGQRFGAVFQHRGPDRHPEHDGQRVVADGGEPVELREGETRDDTAHARRNLEQLRIAREETYQCVICEDRHADRGAALACCPDALDGTEGER